MKNYLVLIAVFIGVIGFGQSKEVDTVIYNGNQKTIKYTDGSQSISVSNKSVIPEKVNQKPKFKSKQDELNYLHTYINHLEKKKEWINANPEEKEKALKSGWFDQINTYINESKARINEIETLLKSKQK